jgi:hypothetical protein
MPRHRLGSGPFNVATLAAIVCAIHSGEAATISSSMVFETAYCAGSAYP